MQIEAVRSVLLRLFPSLSSFMVINSCHHGTCRDDARQTAAAFPPHFSQAQSASLAPEFTGYYSTHSTPIARLINMKVTHAWGPRFPKSVLHEFYQQHSSGGIPVFSIESGPRPPALPSFTCTLTIPAVQTAISSYDETTFTAWSRSKKSAEHAAAEKALAFLVSKGLLQSPPYQTGMSLNARGGGLKDISMREVGGLQLTLPRSSHTLLRPSREF